MTHPYYLHRRTLLQHLMLHGATGSGKTALVLIPMLEQLINLASRHEDSSIVVLDLKGDPAFFHSMRIAAKRRGLRFRWFTTKLRHSTFGFNPFLQRHFKRDMTKNQAAEMYAKAFGLDFGNLYGASYFRDLAVLVLRALLELPEIDSFAKLSLYAKKHPDFFDLPKKAAEQTTHLHASLDALATIEPLNVTPDTTSEAICNNAIDVSDVFEEPQVLYFYLPSTLEDLISFTTSKLFGYLLLTAASMRPPKQRKKVFFCVDEFQRIVSQDFAVFVQQARAFDIGCILATQTTADLYSAGDDFAEVLEENTGTKIDLTGIGKRQSERLIEQSPDGIRLLKSFSDKGPSEQEQVVKSLTYDELTHITAHAGRGLVRTAMPYGLTQCGGRQVRFSADFHIPASEYQRRLHATWPAEIDNPGTLTVTGTPPGAGRSASESPSGEASETQSSAVATKVTH